MTSHRFGSNWPKIELLTRVARSVSYCASTTVLLEVFGSFFSTTFRLLVNALVNLGLEKTRLKFFTYFVFSDEPAFPGSWRYGVKDSLSGKWLYFHCRCPILHFSTDLESSQCVLSEKRYSGFKNSYLWCSRTRLNFKTLLKIDTRRIIKDPNFAPLENY